MDNIFQNIGNKQTLSQKIERTIENAIREKKLAIGSKLPTEREMCESFGVSRTALREALRRLSARGLITIQKGSGMHVAEINIQDAINSLNLYYDLKFDKNLLSQFIEVRRLFEPEIAMLAARNRTEENIAELERNLREFETSDPDNTQLEADIDNKFHLTIVKSTSNPIMQITMEPIYSLLPRMRNYIYANIEGEKEHTLKSHKGIFIAIKEKNEAQAREIMTDHLIRTQHIYEQNLNLF